MSRVRKRGVLAVCATALAAALAFTVLISRADGAENVASMHGTSAVRDMSLLADPPPVSGARIISAPAEASGTTTVQYQGSIAECAFLHDKFPAVPAEGCVNIATLRSQPETSADGTTEHRSIQLCSSYSCDAWHAGVTFDVRIARGQGVRALGSGTCTYGGLAADAIKNWTSHTGDDTNELTEAADFYVIINGIPVTVEWHVRTINRADGSWNVDVYHT